MPESAPEKSTTGRIKEQHAPQARRAATTIPWAMRAGFGLLDAVAPEAAGRVAVELFCRPRRGGRQQIPETPSIAPHRFLMTDAAPEFAVWDYGEGPTILLAHGWDGCAAQMAPFVAPLVRAGYFVAALDLPAHGSSPGTQTNLAEMAEALVRAGRRLGPVHAVIGHSLGGAAAAIALQRGLRAKRAVLLAAPAEMPPFARRFAAALGLGPNGASAMVEEINRRVGGADSIDLTRLGPRQSARLLLLHDPQDREVPFTECERIAATWPNARIQPVPGRGHLRMLRDPEVVRTAVEFVREDRTPLSLAG